MLPTFKSEHAPGVRFPQDAQLINSVSERLKVYHSGKAKAVKSQRIEQALGVSGAKLRAVVNYLNTQGVWVASCGEGYFYAVAEQERADYLRQLESRIAGIRNRIEGLK